MQLLSSGRARRLAAGTTLDLGGGGALLQLSSLESSAGDGDEVLVRFGPAQGRRARWEGPRPARIVRRWGRAAALEFCEPEDDLLVPEFASRHESMRRLQQQILKVAGYDVNILLEGESGTGKNVLAWVLHAHSRRTGQLVRVNCPAIPETLIEAELFGHERGAYTGADRARPGHFLTAADGTIVLDEIGCLPSALQAKLLQVLDERRFLPVGSSDQVKSRARVVAVTNEVLSEKVRKGEFRRDLFFRVNEVVLTVPPLRERPEDVPLLADLLVHRHAARFGKDYEPLEDDILLRLMDHDWPGNVRELENVVKRGLLLGSFDPRLGTTGGEEARGPAPGQTPGASLRVVRASTEMSAIDEALERAQGNRTLAAAVLGISYRTLLRRLKRYKIA